MITTITTMMITRSQTDLTKALEECTSNAACASFLADYDLDEVSVLCHCRCHHHLCDISIILDNYYTIWMRYTCWFVLVIIFTVIFIFIIMTFVSPSSSSSSNPTSSSNSTLSTLSGLGHGRRLHQH